MPNRIDICVGKITKTEEDLPSKRMHFNVFDNKRFTSHSQKITQMRCFIRKRKTVTLEI